jgi:hypothetical protein
VGKRASAFVSDTLHDRICNDPAFPVGSLLSLLAPGSADNVASDQENQEAKAAKEERPGIEPTAQVSAPCLAVAHFWVCVGMRCDAGTSSGPDGEAVCVEAATTTTSIEQVTESICRAMEAGFLQTDREFIEVWLSLDGGLVCGGTD